MRLSILFIFIFTCLLSCSKKTIPNKAIGTSATPINSTTPSMAAPLPTNSVPSLKDSTAIVATPKVAARAFVVINADGEIVNTKNKLPEAMQANVNLQQLARAFTPAQKANLRLRYKTLPPKIIYADSEYVQKSLKGSYIIYKQKFWYWQQKNGLFYLDEVYYK